MGFAELLTIVFVVLKCLNVINWAWWKVFLPEIIAGVIYVLILVIWLINYIRVRKEFERDFKKFK